MHPFAVRVDGFGADDQSGEMEELVTRRECRFVHVGEKDASGKQSEDRKNEYRIRGHPQHRTRRNQPANPGTSSHRHILGFLKCRVMIPRISSYWPGRTLSPQLTND